MMFVSVLLLAIGIVFIVAGFTGWPKPVIGIESETGPNVDNPPEGIPEELMETTAHDPGQTRDPAIPLSRRVSTICLGFVGVFFGIVSVLTNAG
jgi:hypothetical protein